MFCNDDIYNKIDSMDRKKILGQHFSGEKLGLLLACLAGVNENDTVIDTMAGNGDLLASCNNLGVSKGSLFGIEIDPVAFASLKSRLGVVDCIKGSAFNRESFTALSKQSWTVAITNPPYVRYQNLASSKSIDGIKLDESSVIRDGLLNIIRSLTHLDDIDRSMFEVLIKSYSGLSDLAVPSWILNAAILEEGGVLAIILPESWLSRNYSILVHYILLRWFDIEFIVEDGDSCWFKNAQIKTMLLVARKVSRKKSAFIINNETYLKIKLFKSAQSSESLVGALFPNELEPDVLFANEMRGKSRNFCFNSDERITVDSIPIMSMISNVQRGCSKAKWFSLLEDGSKNEVDSRINLPFELADICTRFNNDVGLTTLSEYGAVIGQGLRTGANKFFYVDYLSNVNDDVVSVKTSTLTGGKNLHVKASMVEPALRKQSELPLGFEVDSNELQGGVLVIDELNPSNELREYISYVETLNFGSKLKPKKIVELSAVSPNLRKNKDGSISRRWFMLPAFANRHKPDLLIPRIINKNIKAYLNKNRAATIDANFSTVYIEDESCASKFCILAILNSIWCQVSLELSASVMGGGALKIEAAHLNRMPIPIFDGLMLNKLSILGQELAAATEYTSTGVVWRINKTIIEFVFGFGNADLILEELKLLQEKALRSRK